MNISELEGSPSLEVVNLVLQKLARGEPVTSLAIGEPVYKTPSEIMDIASESMFNGDTHYTSSFGIPEVREAIVHKVRRKNNIKADFDNTIFIAAKQAVYAAMMSIAGTRSKLLVPDPGYFYSEPALISGLVPIPYHLNEDLSFNLDNILSLLDMDTAAVMINTPGNPTGRIVGKQQLEALYEACREKEVKIISDEAYEDLVYEKGHFSVGSLEQIPETVISIFSLSKSYSMTGWRAGYTIANKEITTKIARVIEHTYTCSPPFIQKASAFALQHGDKFIEEFRKKFRGKRNHVEKRLSEIPELTSHGVEGAFYVFPSYELPIKSSILAMDFLNKHGVAVLPGIAFGEAGECHIRISFSGSDESIDHGLDELAVYLSSHS